MKFAITAKVNKPVRDLEDLAAQFPSFIKRIPGAKLIERHFVDHDMAYIATFEVPRKGFWVLYATFEDIINNDAVNFNKREVFVHLIQLSKRPLEFMEFTNRHLPINDYFVTSYTNLCAKSPELVIKHPYSYTLWDACHVITHQARTL